MRKALLVAGAFALFCIGFGVYKVTRRPTTFYIIGTLVRGEWCPASVPLTSTHQVNQVIEEVTKLHNPLNVRVFVGTTPKSALRMIDLQKVGSPNSSVSLEDMRANRPLTMGEVRRMDLETRDSAPSDIEYTFSLPSPGRQESLWCMLTRKYTEGLVGGPQDGA